MSETEDDIDVRLKDLDRALKVQKSRLELHGIFEKDHRLTEKELRDRWSELQTEVNAETHDPAALHAKADWIQTQIAKWVVATDLDYKS